jgi:TolB-like protein
MMPTAEPDVDVARRQLNRVLSSDGFNRNERLGRFLRFVVEQHLEGKDGEIKESVIAIEVFGRGADHDPKQNSIVRNEAARLRARLNEYYVGDGKNDALVIELPKGGYVPAFRKAGVEPAPSTLSPESNSTPPGKRLWLRVAIAGAALAVGALAWWWSQRPNAPIAIAVLPLTNLSPDPANDYFADGLTDEIIRNLSIIDGLAVRSQTSSFVFKGKPRNVREAGKQLQADYIVEGSVLRAGQKLRINAQLVRVRDDFPLWSGKYDRELTDVFAIQDEISRGIVNGLRLKLGRGRRRYETSAEAYDLYLRARVFQDQPNLSGLDKSIPFFEQTIDKDPSFAPAYAGLAVAYAGLSGFDRFGDAERSALILKMRTAAQKAIDLDPLLAEAHYALGMMYARDAQWALSEKSFRRSLQLDPNNSVTRYDLILYLLLPLGKIEEALAQARMAERTDPLSPAVQLILKLVLFSAGRLDEGIAHCPQPCADALILQGRAAEAIPILEEKFKGRLAASGSALLGRAYALAGRRAEAEKIATIQWRPIEQAGIFTALGDKDRAFEALARAIPLGPVRLGRDLTWAEFAPLRGDPRVKALRKRVGLPE